MRLKNCRNQVSKHRDALAHGLRLADFESRTLRDISAELRGEFGHVVRKEGSLVAGAGDGNIAESRVEQIGMSCRVRINENPLRGEPLCTVTRYCVSMIEVAMCRGIEFDVTAVVEARGNVPI